MIHTLAKYTPYDSVSEHVTSKTPCLVSALFLSKKGCARVDNDK